MYTPRKKAFWFAITTRIAILVLQVIFNVLIPDHDADAFKRPLDSTEKVSLYDRIIYFLFNGLTRWDGEYFLHIARYGYTYENTLAFYPLYPVMIRIVAAVLIKIFPLFNIQSMMIVAAILINFVCFVKSTIILYDLTKYVFQNTTIAYKTVMLYCINPASIFFSAIYSESMFAYLTFYTMLSSVKCCSALNISFPLALSTLVRSNGIVNIGFPVYFGLKNLYNSKKMKHQRQYNLLSILWHIFKLIKLKNCFIILSTVIVSLSPFFLLQIYNYIKFCTFTFDKLSLPVDVLHYAIENNLILPGKTESMWCNASIPLAYSYVQKTYWNIGFLRYYQFKQIPNFILALPILYIMLKCIKEFTYEYKDELYSLGFLDSKIERENTIRVKKYPLNMFVFVVHGLFLTVFCLLFVHIQVSTRLLASATPLIYWYCASTMSHKCIDLQYESDENVCSKWKVFFLSQKRYTLQDKFILFYFTGYTIIGCFMFSNFLPWT
ncbi:GPI mannosyltransferase 2 [Pogonomyrmex barbatus]|uniref:GPI mannosyltransferase 2 n=1 Tax=Pogonomyrmex barbatus TaxID=144034 RepID=A0A6I9WTK0_9HYME|nr:GPI mannosyltransferase 2 [Pogonomyrmex barbatus]